MAVTKKRMSYPSTVGQDIDVSYAVWKDDAKKPIGVIQLTHGWAEYGERYEELATFLAENGYVVAAQDHLGHGRTAGLTRIGLYPKGAAKYMVEDMHELYEIMHKQYKKLPYMLYGHSLGSMMVRDYLQKYAKDLTAAVICGTIYSPWCGFLLNPLSNLVAGLFSRSYKKSGKKLDKKNAKRTEEFGNKKPTPVDNVINSWLSYDKENQYNYKNDPYIGLLPTATLLYMLPAFLNAGKLGWIRKIPKELPLFVISGAQDMAGFWGFAPKNLQKKFEKKKRNSTLKVYEHAKHEIHNEGAIKDEVFADLLNFFNSNNPKCK
ncbi:MAG: alpha/beta hydrolase [Clostridia bacterium]|nr:alpha/beta hydrolase [Clostridia bacterium]